MRVACTICSKSKRADPGLLPAVERYLGAHVKETARIAVQEGVPLYLFSGKFGLIAAEEPIPAYDYYLESGALAAIAELACGQMKKAGIAAIDFYVESKAGWKPYVDAIAKACDCAGVRLHSVPFEQTEADLL